MPQLLNSTQSHLLARVSRFGVELFWSRPIDWEAIKWCLSWLWWAENVKVVKDSSTLVADTCCTCLFVTSGYNHGGGAQCVSVPLNVDLSGEFGADWRWSLKNIKSCSQLPVIRAFMDLGVQCSVPAFRSIRHILFSDTRWTRLGLGVFICEGWNVRCLVLCSGPMWCKLVNSQGGMWFPGLMVWCILLILGGAGRHSWYVGINSVFFLVCFCVVQKLHLREKQVRNATSWTSCIKVCEGPRCTANLQMQVKQDILQHFWLPVLLIDILWVKFEESLLECQRRTPSSTLYSIVYFSCQKKVGWLTFFRCG